MDVQDYTGLAGIPIIVALVAIFRPFLPPDDRFTPLLTLILGLLWNEAATALVGGDWKRAIVAGIVVGLSASGLYSQGKTMVKAAASLPQAPPTPVVVVNQPPAPGA